MSETTADPWILVGRGARLRGSKGLITIRTVPSSGGPFRSGQMLQFRKGGSTRTLKVLSAEHYRDRAILKLEGVQSADLAEPLAGSDIYLQSKDLVDLPQGTYYIFRLVGLEVVSRGKLRLGRVRDVLRTGGTDLLWIEGEGGKEFLVPFTRSICHRVDLESGIIDIDPPEGLLEIDAV
jgi:16S rRNA processing protein RimM